MMKNSIQDKVDFKATQVRVLLNYAQSKGEVSPEQFARFHQARQAPDGYQQLDILFNELSQQVHPVTIYTLHASDDYAAVLLDPLYEEEGTRKWSSPRQKTRNLLFFTTIVTSLILLLILSKWMLKPILDMFQITQQTAQGNSFHTFLILLQVALDRLVPFTYGALGACAYVMIEGNNFIWNKQFDAHLIPKDEMRILIGALSGVVGIMLFKSLYGDTTSPNQFINLGEAGVAFIAGYSTDFVFDRLNQIISAIIPRGQATPQKTKARPDATLQKKDSSPTTSQAPTLKPGKMDEEEARQTPTLTS